MPSNSTDNIYSSEYRQSAQPIPADIIGYDNTDSGLTATNAQAAIDELAGALDDLSGADVSYDGTDSGLSATTVQGAVDELAGALDDLSGADVSYDGTTSGLEATTMQDAVDELAGDVATIVQMPALPTDSADGTYVLKATASSGTITYAWVIEV